MNNSTTSYTPKYVFNNIKKEYHLKKTPYVLVEGETDRRLFALRCEESMVKFKSLEGKELVKSIFNQYKHEDCIICYVIDLDTDYITNNLEHHVKYVYNCYPLPDKHFNDIEIYLINTNCFNRLLSEYLDFDIITSEFITNLHAQLEHSSRIYDSFFHAYTLLRLGHSNGKSFKQIKPTNSLYFDAPKKIIPTDKPWIDSGIFKAHISEKLNLTNTEYTLLTDKATELDTKWGSMWTLSRGHTVAAMLAAYLSKYTGRTNISSKDIEKDLRLAADILDLIQLPIAKIIPFKA